MADDAVGTQPLSRVRPWRDGVAVGFGAALAVYSGTVLLLAVEIATLGQASGGATGRAILSGTVGDFYGAHLGATTDLALGVRNVGTVPALVYYLLPPTVLTWSGWLVGRQADGTDAGRTAARGASIVAGYLPAVALSLGALAAGYGGTVVGISPLRVLLVAGVGCPLVCGGVGGYVAGLWRDEKP